MSKLTIKTNKRLFPEYRGYEFWLTQLEGWDKPHYGYQLRSTTDERYDCAGGAYPSKHEATKAAFARIETLTFDR